VDSQVADMKPSATVAAEVQLVAATASCPLGGGGAGVPKAPVASLPEGGE
jgi:hypothetical protein